MNQAADRATVRAGAARPGTVVRARAPLRLGLGGGGTDVSPYCDEYGGLVLNVTIDMFAHVTVEPRADGQVQFTAADQDVSWTGTASASVSTDEPLRLLKGVYNRCVAEFGGGRPWSLSMTSYADSPPGSGLGTSSALVVAMVEALSRFMGAELEPARLARLAYDIERVDLGLAGGRQDQYAAAFGGLNLIHFNPGGDVEVEPVHVGAEIMKEMEASLVLYFTGVSRESAAIIDQQAANMRSRSPQSLEGLHALKAGVAEMQRVLMAGDLPRFGALLEANWANKKKTASNISTGPIEEVYQAAKDLGVFGGKVSGAGGGGFMVFLIDPPRREALKRRLESFGGAAMGARFYAGGVESWRVGA